MWITTSAVPPDIPGRGSWSTQGGLLRLRPGHANPTGYYRLAVAPESMVGAAGARIGASWSATVVHLGVRAIQRQIGAGVDGYFGVLTDRALRRWQAERADEVGAADGIVGERTALAIWKPLIRLVARAHRVPVDVLGGLVRHESRLDPAAVGTLNGTDTGLCQINLAVHDITITSACDPEYALNWTAQDLRSTYNRWAGETTVDRWRIAIANHNSPRAAREWATTGEVPFSQSRADRGLPQIDEYVASVLAAGEVF